MVSIERKGGRQRREKGRWSFEAIIKRYSIVFIVMLLCNFSILSTYLLPPSSSSSLPLTADGTMTKNHNGQRKLRKNHNQYYEGDEEEDPCPNYGCPIYPAELTPYLHEVLHRIYVDRDDEILQEYKEEFDFGTNNFALLTQKGASHHENQDRSVLIQPYYTGVTANHNNTSFLIGVFDGHGVEGHIVADHVVRDLPERLADKLNRLNPTYADLDRQIVQVLKQTFVDVDIYGSPNMLLGGCTGTVTLRIGPKLYIANTGDSQTVVVSVPSKYNNKDPEIAYMTRKDKAKLPEEYNRIVGLGGKVHVNNQTGDSRVFVYSRTARETIGLAMSRSIGDWEWKPVGVTAEPLVDIIDLTLPKYKLAFLIAASDGIWDVRRREFYAKQLVETFYRGSTTPLQKVWDVIQKVTPKAKTGYRDDITLVATKL